MTVLEGAEPFSSTGGPAGVLVVHGFTGSPQSMRPLAEAFAKDGFTVELPLLPGHGTSVDDMLRTSWPDWSSTAEQAYSELAARCPAGVVVAGLSMGGTITVWLASRHPEIKGIVCVNPAIEPPAESFRDLLDQMRSQGHATFPAIGNDVADPDVEELAYDQTPVEPLFSMLDAQDALAPHLAEIAVPLLLCNSPQDHVVPPSSAEYLAAHYGGPVERVVLERSYHVATIDFDHELVEQRAVAFARRVTSTA